MDDIPHPRVIATVLDTENGVARLLRSDGKESLLPLHDELVAVAGPIARATYFLGVDAMHCVTMHGEDILAELPGIKDAAPLAGRPVIYLDQKDWNTIANALSDRCVDQPQEETDAALALVELVNDRKVVLPFSSAHLMETTQWSNREKRYGLALTILQLSRGWQMRDPIAVREAELANALTTDDHLKGLPAHNVFTLAPGAVMEARTSPYEVGSGLPPELALATQALASLQAYIAVMLDGEQTEQTAVPGWAQRQQRFSNAVAGGEDSRQAVDQAIDLFFLQDIASEIAQAAQRLKSTTDEVAAWLRDRSSLDVPRMPALGIHREVLRERHLNAQGQWKQSDLIDLMYLTCAAGYADHVVAERNFTHHVAAASRRLGRELSVHRNIRTLVAQL